MNKATVFLMGGLVGAVAGLLYAPRSGAETRVLVSERMNSMYTEAVESGYVPAAAQTVCTNASVVGQDLYDKASAYAKEAAESAAPVFADRSDELREKIEAARQRIAAQVIQNAEAVSAPEEEIVVEAAQAAEEQVACEAEAEVAQEASSEEATEEPQA